MTPSESEVWAFDIKWDPATKGPKLNEVGDDFEYAYNEAAVGQAVYLAVRDSGYAGWLTNAHPQDIAERLNLLTEELENEEWSLELGSIDLNYDYDSNMLEFSAEIADQNQKSIRFALDLTKE